MIKMKISFWLRNGSLHVRVPYKGTYMRLSTRIKVPTHLVFHVSKQKFAGNSDEVASYNAELVRHTQFIQKVLETHSDLKKEYETFVGKNSAISIDEEEKFDIYSLCCRYIQEASSGKIRKRSGSCIKPSSLITYRGAIAHWNDFSVLYGKIDMMEYNLAMITDLNKKRQLADRWDSYFSKFVEYLTRVGMLINTKSMIMNITAIIIRHYASKYFLVVPELPKVAPSLNPIVVLDPEFMWGFLKDSKYEKLEGEMKYTWEIAATIMVTSMRISDVVSIKWENLTERKNGMFMSKVNMKTSEPTYTMIPPRLANIYRENMAKHGHIFCLNKYKKVEIVYKNMSELFASYPELHKEVSMTKLDPRGVPFIETKPLYKWVTPHMLRKTAITAMMVDGRSDDFIRLHSGHSRRTNTLERYKGFVESHFNQEMNSYASRFAE